MGSVIPLKKSANSAYLELKNLLSGKLKKVEELIEIATCLIFLKENAFFKIALWPAKSMPCLNLPAAPITPVNLTCGTTIFLLKNENII